MMTMLTMRTRGKAQIYYIRGTVTLGDQSIDVTEFSSGTRDKETAGRLMAAREREISEQLIFGPKVLVRKATLSDAFEAYLIKAVKANSSDVLRVTIMRERIGQMSLGDPATAWHSFRDTNLRDHAPAGQDRYRSLLQACVNVFHDKHGLPPFKLKAIPFDNQRIRFLSHAERDSLIESYVAHVRPIATIFAFQGPRTQEALQLSGTELMNFLGIMPEPAQPIGNLDPALREQAVKNCMDVLRECNEPRDREIALDLLGHLGVLQ